MRARLRAAACVASLALFGVPRAAGAAPVLRIEWPTVPGCPDSSVVLARARAAIAQSKDVEDVRAVAEITPPAIEGGPWLLHIRTRTARAAGERTLEVPSCDAVARTAALLVALAALRARAPAEEHAVEELTPAPRIDESIAPAAPLPLPKRAREASLSAGRKTPEPWLVPAAGLGVTVGLLPRAAPVASAMLAYERAALRARVGVRALFPQDAVDRGVGAELTALGASFDVCARFPLPLPLRGRPHGCAGAMADDVHARGIGGIQAFDVRRTAVMAFGGAGAEWTLGRAFRLGADARVGHSLVRPGFVIDSDEGQRLLHRPAVVRAEAALTFGTVF